MVPKELGKGKPHIKDLCPLGHNTATADLNPATLTFMRRSPHALVESGRALRPLLRTYTVDALQAAGWDALLGGGVTAARCLHSSTVASSALHQQQLVEC